MLDSLVRVSRRVGGAADLLGREMRTATERCSLYESSQLPVGRGARTPGAASRTDNFTQSLRSEPNGSCRKLRRKCTQEPSRTKSAVIADRTHPDRPTPRLSSPQRLREPPRLHKKSLILRTMASLKCFLKYKRLNQCCNQMETEQFWHFVAA